MAKRSKSRESKMGHKPTRGLVPSAEHTAAYQDKLNNPDHMQVSTPTTRPTADVPTPQGGDFWGDPNRMAM